MGVDGTPSSPNGGYGAAKSLDYRRHEGVTSAAGAADNSASVRVRYISPFCPAPTQVCAAIG